jgi:hypothetical protein
VRASWRSAYAQLNNMDRVVHFTVISSQGEPVADVLGAVWRAQLAVAQRREGSADQIDYVADRVLRLLYRRNDRRCIHRVLGVLEPFGRTISSRKWVFRERYADQHSAGATRRSCTARTRTLRDG